MSMVYVSGATGGFGRSMAVECASRGWDLFLTDMDEEKLKVFSGALSSAWDVSVVYHVCDMASEESRTALLEAMQALRIQLDMVVNVAGLDYEGCFLDRTREEILHLFHVNDISTVDMMHSLTAMRDTTKPFRIINVCSLAGMFSMPVKASYASSKSLLIQLSIALREEFKSINGSVTALCPAGMATNEILLKSLHVQGFAGKMTTLEVGTIAKKTVDAALKGRAVYIPGMINRILLSISRLLPATFVAQLIGNRWRKTNKHFEAMLSSISSQ